MISEKWNKIEILSGSYTIEEIGEMLPGWLHINTIDDFSIVYMNKRMQSDVGATLHTVRKSGRAFLEKHMHPETTARIVPLLVEFIKNADDQKIISFFQLFKTPKSDYRWYYTSLKLLSNTMYTIAITNPVADFQDFNQEIQVILNENIYLKTNLKKYENLTNREKQIIRFLTDGKTQNQVAEILNISEYTVKTHKQNIYKKLQISNICELLKFSNIFGIT